jgi:uncharacterized protein (TIGR02996 family)
VSDLDDGDRDLLAAIAAAPDDDAPRLVYADRLLERGDPYGELIETQCAAARLPGGEARAKLEARAAELLEQHTQTWLAPLRPWVSSMYRWERGFMVAAELSLLALRDRPVLSPLLSQLAHVRIQFMRDGSSRPLDDEIFQWIAAWPVLERLRSLEMPIAADATSKGVVALAESPLARGLRWLQLSNVAMDVTAGSALAALSLSSLSLDRCALDASTLRALGRGVLAPHTLDLHDTGLDADRIASLANDGPLLAGVRALDLGHTRPGAALTALLESPGFRPQWLLLDGCALGVDHARVLAMSSKLTALERLDVSDNTFGQEGVTALIGSLHLPRSMTLYLDAGTAGLEERTIYDQGYPIDSEWDGLPSPALRARFEVQPTVNNSYVTRLAPRPMRNLWRVGPATT